LFKGSFYQPCYHWASQISSLEQALLLLLLEVKQPYNGDDTQIMLQDNLQRGVNAMSGSATMQNRAFMRSRKMRLLAVASGGGHWVQLLRLRPAFSDHQVTYVTVNKSYRADIGSAEFCVVNDTTRQNWFGLVLLCIRLLWHFLRVRPDVVVTTGAAPGYFAVRLGKLFGARTIWIDSIANVSALSLSGQRAEQHVDLCLTQWSHLSSKGGPQFAGAVL